MPGEEAGVQADRNAGAAVMELISRSGGKSDVGGFREALLLGRQSFEAAVCVCVCVYLCVCVCVCVYLCVCTRRRVHVSTCCKIHTLIHVHTHATA